MLSSFVLGRALLRTQRSAVARPLCRHKSITAAIEKGRGSGPDRFAAPRGDRRTRSRDDALTPSRYDRGEGGRARPSRSKSSVGARRRRWDDDEDAAPRRKELRKSGGRPDESAVDRRLREQDREAPRWSDDRGERPERDGRRPGGRGRDAGPGGRDRDAAPGGRDGHAGPRVSDRHAGPEWRDAPRRRRDDMDDGARPLRRPDRTFDRGDQLQRTSERFARDDRPQRRLERTPAHGDRRSPHNDRDSRTSQSDRSDRSDRPSRSSMPSRASPRDRAPDSLPYTTAASEFIYGYASVLAAIRANRRQFYTLYVNSRGLNRDSLLARARASSLRHITREVGDSYDRAFDKASSGRPHNGFILEASPLPVQPITELKECVREEGSFAVALAPQTKEELAVNGTRSSFPCKSSSWRHPLILYLDGILDEGNLGAIARSAYFLGVDAIVTPTRQSAPWSHIAVKASAGAAEAMPLFRVADPADFLGKASRNGWRCYAADAIPTPKSRHAETAADAESAIVYTLARSTTRLPDHSPVAQHPTILMLGAEGTGLKPSLLNMAHYKVGIKHGRDVDEVGVDSLNVSVAAGILCLDMLKKSKLVERDPENIVF
ncbi:rRNA methyltransferase 1, mitochondrial [Stagonosporopsis vannaccii]|nr:rRNA methyltransferase 1, mitochondrial [Stagonosporopsis vannaccii]